MKKGPERQGQLSPTGLFVPMSASPNGTRPDDPQETRKKMTSDSGTAKSQPTPQAATTPSAASTPSKEASKPEAGAPSNYSRGESQKPVTDTYKENWNRIYGK